MNTFTAYFEIISTNDKCVILQDLDGPKSITNDAESVYGRMCGKGNLQLRRLFYFDSYGDSAELVQPASSLRIIPLPYKTIEEINEYVVFETLK